MRRAHGAFAFDYHEYMIVVFMIVHVVLNLGFAVDYPEVSQIGSL
jgi:hypothetical protein